MLVGERMTKPAVTVNEDASIDQALQRMREHKIRRLPVLNKRGRLVGMVSEKDLLYASPSPATALSIHEVAYLLSRVKVRDVMSKELVTVTEATPIEEAARIMADRRIGGVPVMRDHEVVGIITESDIFKILLEMLGARTEGVRVSLLVPEGKGILAKITARIAEIGGNILALGTTLGRDPTNREIIVRVSGVDPERLVRALETLELPGGVVNVLDVRYCILRPANG
jgi:acetoin utilization protein AcuB